MLADGPKNTMEVNNAVYAEREACVHAWQRHYRMEPRMDSKLTGLFAAGQLAPHVTADVIARELVATDYVYKSTLYGELIEEFMRGVAARLRAVYPNLSWPATWHIVRFYGPIALRLMCLSATGLRIPEAGIWSSDEPPPSQPTS